MSIELGIYHRKSLPGDKEEREDWERNAGHLKEDERERERERLEG